MSAETQGGERRPWSGGARARAGAAEAAPTAPHATPSAGTKRRRSGPERFWGSRWARLALGLALVASAVIHYELSPWSFFPERTLELKDTDGEITIPIDMIEGPSAPPAPPPPPPPPAADTAAKPGEEQGRASADAGGPSRATLKDAGVPRDAEIDAEAAADAGASSRPSISDGGLPDAAAGGESGDGGLDNASMAGPTLVEIRVNIGAIRTNPVGARMGPLLLGIPQWADFLGGTDVDPVKDLEWIWIFGPSLIHTDKDAAVLRYNMTDDRAAKNIGILSKRDVGGGKFDTGVAGVRAWRGRADNAWRVFMLPRPHVAAMVPPDFAKTAARAFSRSDLRPPTRPNEAVRVMVKNPSHPMPFLPASLTELRFWASPREGGGADAYVEADAPDDRAAALAAKQIRQLVAQQNSIGVRLVTRGLLNDFDVTSDGALVKGHAPVSQEQLEALYDLVAAYLGVPPTAEPRGSASAGAPSAAPIRRTPRSP